MDRDAMLVGRGSQGGSTEVAQLADELMDEIAAARRHYAEARTVIDGGGRVPRSTLDEAELAVVSMALAGGTREEVERHLREDFGVEHPDELLERAPAPLPAERPKRSRRRFARRLRART